MREKNGGPAFPTLREDRSEDLRWVDDGMTLRDWFAGQALAGMLAHPDLFDDSGIGQDAYIIADIMLAAREGTAPDA